MAKNKLAWKELRVGILVIVSVLFLVVAIFYVGGDSGFLAKKYTVTAYFQSANGLHAGAAVLLDGVTIGNVASVKLLEDSADSGVEATLRLNKNYQKMIHTDAVVTIGTVGLLGDQEVELRRGSPDMPIVEDNGSLHGKEVGDIEQIKSSISTLVPNLNNLTTSMGDMIKNLNQGQGTMGLILKDRTLHDKLTGTLDDFRATSERVNSLVEDMKSGKGAMSRFMYDEEMSNSIKSSILKLNTTVDKMNTTLDTINNGDGTFAKLLHDHVLYDNVNQTVTKFNPILDRINNGEGTLGKLSKDEALINDIHSTLTRTNSLLAAMESGGGTVDKLIHDPTMYNSLNQTSSELQKLMYDFRQHPKKYLTINFRLF